MEIVTLIAVMTGVSWFVLNLIEGGEHSGPPLRVKMLTLGRRASRALLNADRLLRDLWARTRSLSRSGVGIARPRPRARSRFVSAPEPRPSRLASLLELVLLAVLIGAVVAGAIAGAAWGMGRFLLD